MKNELHMICLALYLAIMLVMQPAAAQTTAATTLLSSMTAHLPALLQGIPEACNRTAAASPYIIWSPNGFPVALGGNDSNVLPVVAAVNLPSGGRIVAFGHESMLGSCCSRNDAWDRLTLNAFRWLAAGKRTVRVAAPAALTWASAGITGVKSALTDLTIQSSTLELDSFASGGWANVDVYWINTTSSYTAAQVTALLSFANSTGKGLLVAGQVASWASTRPNANVFTDLEANQLLWPLGLAVTSDALSGLQPPARSSRPYNASWPFYNSFYTASLLAAARSNASASFNDTAMYPAANAALSHLLKSLPIRAATAAAAAGLQRDVWALLEAARSVRGRGPGPDRPMDPRRAYPGDVLDVNMDVWANRRGDLTGLWASRSASAYPGVPAANASRVTVSLTVNGTYNRPQYRFYYAGWAEPVWRSTGLYSAPGEVVTVSVLTPSALNKGLMVQVGAHTDDLTVNNVWFRVPYACSRFPILKNVTLAGNPLGGPVYILVPRGLNLSDVQVTVSNAVQAPWFKLGRTSLTDWKNTIRKYPGPWAELDSGKFVIMLPSSVIRAFDDPIPLLQHWNQVMDHMAWLANMPAERARAERFLVDADVAGSGWMHSGYPVVAHDDPAVIKEVTDVNSLKSNGNWAAYHELGHNHQWGNMQFGGSLESFNELWNIYSLVRTNVTPTNWLAWRFVSPAGRANLRASYFAKGANWQRDWNSWVALDTYLQLQEAFGWEFFRKLYGVYQNLPMVLPDGEVQTFIQQSSFVAGVNLVPFYTRWGFPMTQRTITAVASLPTWASNPFLSSSSVAAARTG